MFAKHACGKPYRGFESPSLRNKPRLALPIGVLSFMSVMLASKRRKDKTQTERNEVGFVVRPLLGITVGNPSPSKLVENTNLGMSVELACKWSDKKGQRAKHGQAFAGPSKRDQRQLILASWGLL